jgi:prepilin-type N-terminal cleavage/methylation domain-containing protein
MNWNDKGMTLLELILAVVLVSIILAVVFMFYHFGSVSFENESISASNQQNLRLIMNDITKEIRNHSDEQITVDQASSTITIDTVVYRLNGNSLMKNSNLLMDNVGKFDVSKNNNIISVEIESTANRSGNTESLKTTIAIRK